MAAATFQLQIVTQEGVVLQCPVESLRAPGADGYFGVKRGHAPLVAELTVGTLLVREPSKKVARCFACSGGICEVMPSQVVILADAVEENHKIDVSRAQAAETRARDRLNSRTPDTDLRRAEIALRRALNRLKVAGRSA
ncbi:ATP synthase F1 subunit epsilon [bacterium]|nr:ATP synthase F1 subunit epsilon [bacterium]